MYSYGTAAMVMLAGQRDGNGDQIEIGAVNLQFWLGNVRKKNHRPVEKTLWMILGILVLSEFILLLWLR